MIYYWLQLAKFWVRREANMIDQVLARFFPLSANLLAVLLTISLPVLKKHGLEIFLYNVCFVGLMKISHLPPTKKKKPFDKQSQAMSLL